MLWILYVFNMVIQIWFGFPGIGPTLFHAVDVKRFYFSPAVTCLRSLGLTTNWMAAVHAWTSPPQTIRQDSRSFPRERPVVIHASRNSGPERAGFVPRRPGLRPTPTRGGSLQSKASPTSPDLIRAANGARHTSDQRSDSQGRLLSSGGRRRPDVVSESGRRPQRRPDSDTTSRAGGGSIAWITLKKQ